MSELKILAVTCLGVFAGTAAWAAANRPVAVSPGDLSAAPEIADHCPTFNWGSVEGAKTYELVVYRLTAENESSTAGLEPELRVTLPGSAHGWTPALEHCLAHGGRYAWSLRSRGQDGPSEWSEVSFFQVAAAPSVAEVEAALAVLHAYVATGRGPEPPGDLAAQGTEGRTARAPQPNPSPAPGSAARLSITPDATAIAGEHPATPGIGFGLHGISSSDAGGSAGVVGQSTAAGGDVAGVVGQVSSAAGAAGAFDNTAGGDVLRGFSGGVQVFHVDGAGQVGATGFSGDGSALTSVTAASAGDLGCTACVSEGELDFDPATQAELDIHGHAGEDITTGTVADSRIDPAVARDGEILPAVLAGDGAGSTLDADLLDGLDSSAFLTTASDAWVDESGDTMTGTLVLDPVAGHALETSADVVLDGDVIRGGTRFLHADGNDNTALGDSALINNTIAGGNTAVGAYALYSNTTGIYNTALGAEALNANTTSNYNTAVGAETLKHSVNGGSNTALGYAALYSDTMGFNNTASGAWAMYLTTTGTDNVAIGYHALDQNTSGTGNVAIGSYAGHEATTGDQNVFISNYGQPGDTGTIRIGQNVHHSRAFIAGIASTTLSGDPVVIDASGQLGVSAGGGGDADTLDALDSTDLLRSNASDDFTAGTLTTAAGTTLDVDGVLDASDATAVVLPPGGILGAGPGSGLNADQLDGLDSSAFLTAATDNWVDVTGDTMTGTLTTADIDMGGSLLKSGQPFLHNNGTRTTAVGLGALSVAPPGTNNTAVGYQALSSNTSGGVNNTSTGTSALRYNMTGSDNTAVGTAALRNSTTGKKNTAVGKEALRNSTGHRNLALGYRAGYNIAASSDNILVGHEGTASDSKVIRIGTAGTHFFTYVAGIANSTFSGDPVVVDASGRLGVSPAGPIDAETLDGLDSEQFLRSDVSDTLSGQFVTVGSGTLLDIQGSFQAVGASSFSLPSSGIFGAGPGSGLNADKLDWMEASDFMPSTADNWLDQSGDTATGLLILDPPSGLALQTGFGDSIDLGGNVLMDGTLFLHNTGTGNTAAGGDALSDNVTGGSNTAVGAQALDANTIGSENTAVGRLALSGNTNGSFNTAVGVSALASNTTCCNTALGNKALQSNSTGQRNTAVGFWTLKSTTNGSDNTAVGFHALISNTTGIRNTAMGTYALDMNAGGFANTAMGNHALTDNTTGIYNVAVGASALGRNSTGGANIALGVRALYLNTSGNANVAIGNAAGSNATTGAHNIFISNTGVAGEAATIRLGTQGTQTRAFIAGIRGVTTDVADAVTVLIDSQGQLGTVSSSRRFKEDVRDMGGASSPLLDLRPVTFRYRPASASAEPPLRFGLIAEEVAEVLPELVVFDQEGRPETISYHLLSSMLLNELQKQDRRIRQLELELAEQKRRLRH